MKARFYLLHSVLIFKALSVIAQNAPVTMAPEISVCGPIQVDIPISVTSFNSIGAISLTLNFNASALEYISFTNDSNFPGLFIANPASGIITAAGFDTNTGISLADYAVLFTLHFNFLGGYSGLSWLDDGPSCEYAGAPPAYPVLNDTPQNSFYLNGSVNELPLPSNAGNITGPENGNVCIEESNVFFSVPVVENATTYNWSLPPGAAITGSGNTNEILVDFSTSAQSGNVFVFGVNECGNGLQSPSFFINVNEPPSIQQQPVTPDTVEAGQGVASFLVIADGVNLSYSWQEYTSSWEPLSNGLMYSGVFSSTLTITGPGISMNGNKYRCIVTGFCEPPAITDGLATLYVNDLTGISSVEKNTEPDGLILSANPNPFKSDITFYYQLPKNGNIVIDIMNIRGDFVVSLPGKDKNKGSYNQYLSLDNLNSGIYLARIRLITETEVLISSVKILCKK